MPPGRPIPLHVRENSVLPITRSTLRQVRTGREFAVGEKQQKAQGRVKGWWRPITLLAIILTLAVSAGALGLGRRLGTVREWMQKDGAAGAVVFVLVRAGAAVAMLPGSVLSMAAGALFGSAMGIVYVSAGTTLGATASFVIARYLARAPVERWVAKNETFRRVDDLTSRYGAVIVALARLVPIVPFNFQNYGFGLTGVRLSTYVFWSWLSMLPGTILAVVGGDLIARTLLTGSVPWPLVGVLASVAVCVGLLALYALFKLRAKTRDEKSE